MPTRLQVRGPKLLDDVDIGLARTVVFTGPNNSVKTAALQAMAL